MPLIAVEDAVKWTDVGTFWATAVQAFVVIVALVVAYVQYRGAVSGGRVQLMIDMTKEISAQPVRDAIDHTSAHLDFREDWEEIKTDLQLPSTGDRRRACRERELFVIANLFSTIDHLYRENLVDRGMFLNEYDEYVLFVAAAVSGVSDVYQQPDYRGLFNLARRCQANYRQRCGRYDTLKSFEIPDERTGRLPAAI